MLNVTAKMGLWCGWWFVQVGGLNWIILLSLVYPFACCSAHPKFWINICKLQHIQLDYTVVGVPNGQDVSEFWIILTCIVVARTPTWVVGSFLWIFCSHQSALPFCGRWSTGRWKVYFFRKKKKSVFLAYADEKFCLCRGVRLPIWVTLIHRKNHHCCMHCRGRWKGFVYPVFVCSAVARLLVKVIE